MRRVGKAKRAHASIGMRQGRAHGARCAFAHLCAPFAGRGEILHDPRLRDGNRKRRRAFYNARETSFYNAGETSIEYAV